MPSRPSARGAALGDRLGRARRLRAPGRRRAATAISALAARTAARAAAQHGRRARARRPRRAPRRRRAPRARGRSRARARRRRRSPVRNSARACERPMRASANGAIVAGISPSRTSVKPKRASSRASTMSQQQARPVPPPSAAPCTRADHRHGAAVDGREHGREALGVGDVLLVRAARPRRASTRGRRRRRSAGPRPASTTARSVASPASDGERLAQRGDQLGVERVAALGPVEPHARDAAVALDREAAHMRKTPKRGSGIGARAAAARPSASTRRVSRGSITPSSQRRARRVAGVALVLVALEDRLHERCARLLVQVLAARPQRVEAHRQQRLARPGARPSPRCARSAT